MLELEHIPKILSSRKPKAAIGLRRNGIVNYLLPQRLHPTIYVGTTVILFTVVNYVKLIPYSLLGQLRTESLVTSLVLLPLAPAGILLGKWLHDRVDEVLFYRIAYGLLLITGLKLVSEGFSL